MVIGQQETACEQCGSGIEGLVGADWASAYLRVTPAKEEPTGLLLQHLKH